MTTYVMDGEGGFVMETSDMEVGGQDSGHWELGGRVQLDISEGAGINNLASRRLLVDQAGNSFAFNDTGVGDAGSGAGHSEIGTHLDPSSFTPILVAEQTGIALTGLQSDLSGNNPLGSIEVGNNFVSIPGNSNGLVISGTAEVVRVPSDQDNLGGFVIALGNS